MYEANSNLSDEEKNKLDLYYIDAKNIVGTVQKRT